MEVASQKPRSWRSWVLDSVLVFVLAAGLIAPMFRIKYLDNWGSIESIFISDARSLRDHGFHMRWQPDWYSGTRWDYIYPPALRYGTALIATYPRMTPARAYHLYISFFYCLGIAGVYWLTRTGTGSRLWGVSAALLVAVLSPSFLFIKDVAADAASSGLPPQRLHALMRYGEGPHVTSLGWLGIALACAWRGLRRGRDGWLALTVLCITLVVSNNFYGATALAILFPALLWALWLTTGDAAVWWRGALAAALSYGLCAFWLTPSYLQLTLHNMRHVSKPGTSWSGGLAVAVALAVAAATWRWGRLRPGRTWPVFVATATTFMTLNVLGNYYFNFRVLGEPQRLIPELDLLLILTALLPLDWLWDSRPRWRWAFLLPAAGVLFAASPYLRAPYRMYVRSDHEGRIEYKLTKWIHENLPGRRVFVTGSLRFWYNAWFNGQMVGGGSEQGMLNQYSSPVVWAVCMEPVLATKVAWLQSFGASAVVVHDKRSMEIYKDMVQPELFVGQLDVLHDSGQGDIIYRVPRRYPALARVVDSAQLDAAPEMRAEGDNQLIHQYAAVIEKGPAAEPQFEWLDAHRIRLRAPVGPGQSLLVQETWDPAWRATTASGVPLPIRRTILQYMRLDPPPGDHEILLEFTLPLENRIGWGLALLGAAGVALLAWRARRSALA